jgi:cytochrome c556
MLKASQKIAIALTIGALTTAAVSIAQNAAPADTIRARQQNLKDMGASFKTVRDQLRVSSPDFAAIKTAGADIKSKADAMATWFPKGTGTEAGIKTGALPEIWTDTAGFDTARKNFVAAAGKFAEVTASGDKAAIQAGVGPIGGACKGCHDKYRLKED